MSKAFSPAQLANYRRVQTAHMMDSCLVERALTPGTKNSFGNPAITYATPVRSACGYQPSATNEVQIGNETVTVDAVIRLPSSLIIGSLDRVTIDYLKGEEQVPPLKFDVVGQPAKGPSGHVVGARRITY